METVSAPWSAGASEPVVAVAGNPGKEAAKAVVFEEHFAEFMESFAWPPAGWTLIDNNGDGQNWGGAMTSATQDGSGCATSVSFVGGPFGGAYDPDNYLITPQISIPSEGIHRLSYAIGYSNMQFPGNHYEVLVSTTGTDLADFTMIHEEIVHLSPGASFYEVELPLDAYAGQDIYIAFRHNESAEVMGDLYLDDIVVEDIPMAPVFSGAESLNFGAVLDIDPAKKAYYVVENTGTQELTVEEVSASAELELEGLPMAIAPGGQDTLTVIMGEVHGDTYAGEFVLSTNDPERPTVTVQVMAAAITAARVTGFHFEDFEAGLPDTWFCWGFNLDGTGGINASASLSSGSSGTNVNMLTTHYVEMGDNPVVEFWYKATDASTGLPASSRHVMFNVYVSDDYGTVYTPVWVLQPGSGLEHEESADWQKVSLPLPGYAGKTCIVGIETGAANGGNWVCQIDNMSIGTKPQAGIAVDVLQGEAKPTAGTAFPYSVSVANIGLDAQGSYTLKLMESGKEEALATVEGESLASGDYKTYELSWTPSEAGELSLYAEVVSGNDEEASDNRTADLPVEVLEEGSYAIAVGEGSLLAYAPVNMWNRESASQTLYFPHEIGANTGKIESIMYYTQFDYPTVVDAPTVRIFFGETDKENFSDKEWVDVSGLTEVYNGKLRAAGGGAEWKVDLETPYEYHGGNLVVYAVMGDWSSGVMSNNFRNTNYPGSSRTLSIATDQVPAITPENPNPNGWPVSLSDMAPDITFFMRFDNTGSVSGTVSDTTKDDVVEGVKVSVQGSGLYALSDAQGRYSLPYLESGSYTLTASKFSYKDTTFDVTVSAGQAVTADLVLMPEKALALRGNVRRADNGDPIEGAQVSLDGMVTYTASTDSEGFYAMEGIYLDETWTFRVSAPGFIAYDTMLAMQDDMVLDVSLDESPLPVQLLRAEIVDSNAHVAWYRPDSIAWEDFRYDSDVRMGQLGLTDTLPKALMGTVYRTPAELYEMSWFNSVDGSQTPPELADLYILGLDSAGMPSGEVLYSAIGVENAADVWNTHVLSHPVKAPEGFMLAIGNAYGFCGLGIAVGTDEYPFVENANFYTQDYTSGPWITLEDSRYQLNFMIRASGIELAEAGQETQAKAGSGEDPDFELYRFAEGQEEADWTLLEITRETSYVDSAWSDLASGVYYYAVKAAYSRLTSVPSISEAMPKDMYVKVSVDLSANDGTAVEGALLSLVNRDGLPDHAYSLTAGEASVLFPEVWKGVYGLSVELDGYETFRIDSLAVHADTSLSVELAEALDAPVNLRIAGTDDPAAKDFSWNNEAEIVFMDDVETYEDFIIEDIGNYTLVDGDGGPTWVMAFSETGAYDYPNNGYTGSFQVLNPYAAVPVMTDLVMPHSGQKVLACADANTSMGPGNNNDWLILPKLSISENMAFRFYAKGVGNAAMYGYERMNVGVSLSGSVDDFTFFNGDRFIEVPDTAWTEYVFDLGDYAGQEIYLAVNCVSRNSFMLVLDDLYVGSVEEESKAEAKGDAKRVEEYVVYLDEEEAGTTRDVNYRFEGLSEGLHTAGVKAVYTTGESETVSKEFEVDLPHKVIFSVMDSEGRQVEDALIVFAGDTLSGYVAENVFDGTYSYVVSKEGYADKSGTVTMAESDVSVVVTLSGVGNEAMAEAGIRLYPNPFSEEIRIDNPALVERLWILDIQGRKMLEIASPEASVPVASLRSGVYMVVIETADGESLSCKMVKR